MLALAPEVFFIFSFSKYARLSGGGVLHPDRFLRVNNDVGEETQASLTSGSAPAKTAGT